MTDMIIEQIYTGCLAQGAYYIESKGEAVVIDPLRDTDHYIIKAKKSGAVIKYILETHFHADFVSGHLDLAKATGAVIVYGPTATPSFDALIAKGGQVLNVGEVTFKVLHTPGHTLESCCFLLSDEEGRDIALFSGDTLFLGDVGRPDLAQKAANMTQEELAGLLYDSIRNKILPLNDDITVYPGHGAGSACGKNMSAEKKDTLGNQKQANYALRADMTREEFIREVTMGLVKPPQYFPMNVMLNKQGYRPLEEIIREGTRPLTVKTFETVAATTDALILDTRDPEVFAAGFIPGSVNIGLNGNFAPWVGALVKNLKQPILIVADEGSEKETVTRLSRVGYDNSIGYLSGGFDNWENSGKPVDTIESITADTLADRLEEHPAAFLLDVRKNSEFESEHVLGSVNIPLDDINESMNFIDKETMYYVSCAGGYRSMIFISILKARGYQNLVNVKGGFKAIKESARFNISSYHTPSTML